MKNLIKGLALSTTIILGLTFTVAAQDQVAKTDNQKKERPLMNFTDAQKDQMKANREGEKLNRQKFEASLNADQKTIMDDKALNGKEKMDKLMPLLNKEQKDVLKANKVQAKKNQDAFKTTLSKEQQEQFEKMKEKMGERMGDRKKGPNAKKPAGDENGK
jgi:hypothetical protein